MNIVFLTADDPLYLPEFFDRVLSRRARDTRAVFLVPPLYKGQGPVGAAWRYYRTFGGRAAAGLALRVARAKARRNTIASVCERHEVQCSTVRDVNAPSFVGRLAEDPPDLLVSVSCPQIFKRELLSVPTRGCLNIHGALLPQYRGIMPSFWMLANGERRAGVSIYFMNELIDAGDLCGQRSFPIDADATLDTFLQRSKQIAADLLLGVLDEIEQDTVEAAPLDLTNGSYYSWPDREAVARFRAAGRQLW